MRLALVLLAPVLVAAAPPSGPLGNAPVAGPRTQVATLASVHLSEFPEWKPALLEPLIDRLVAFRPTVVTQEGVSGEQCFTMKALPDRYAESYDGYCWNPDTILGETKLSVPEALRALRGELDSLAAGSAADPARRRRLAMLFLAAGDRPSARVQWLRLDPAERRAGDGLSETMVGLITRSGKAMNESYDIAAVVAARAGLEQVHAVDDHSADAAIVHLGKPFEEAQKAHFAAAAQSPLFARYRAETAAVRDGASMLRFYQAMNARHAMDAQVKADFGGAMAQDRPGTPARAYVGWWDTRNLRMAANIRESFAARPGARVLNIVGASHKPWYDALMAMMADVSVVDSAALLAAPAGTPAPSPSGR